MKFNKSTCQILHLGRGVHTDWRDCRRIPLKGLFAFWGQVEHECALLPAIVGIAVSSRICWRIAVLEDYQMSAFVSCIQDLISPQHYTLRHPRAWGAAVFASSQCLLIPESRHCIISLSSFPLPLHPPSYLLHCKEGSHSNFALWQQSAWSFYCSISA